MLLYLFFEHQDVILSKALFDWDRGQWHLAIWTQNCNNFVANDLNSKEVHRNSANVKQRHWPWICETSAIERMQCCHRRFTTHSRSPNPHGNVRSSKSHIQANGRQQLGGTGRAILIHRTWNWSSRYRLSRSRYLWARKRDQTLFPTLSWLITHSLGMVTFLERYRKPKLPNCTSKHWASRQSNKACHQILPQSQ